MSDLRDHLQIGNYLCFKRTGKIAYIEEVTVDPRWPTQLHAVLIGPSGRRHNLRWYQLLDLTRPATALEVLARLGNEPEVAERDKATGEAWDGAQAGLQ